MCGFLVAVRDFLQKRTVATRATIRGKISSLSMADFADLRTYIEAAEALFSKAFKMGVMMDDDEKIYFLLQGLSPEYVFVKQMITAQEDMMGRAPTFEKVLGTLETFADVAPKVAIRRGGDTTFASVGRHAQRPSGGADARPRAPERTRSDGVAGDCWEFQRVGECRKTDCKFRHVKAVKAAGKVVPRAHVVKDIFVERKKVKEVLCWNCGKVGHRKAECRSKPKEKEVARVVVDDWTATTIDKVATSAPTTPFEPSEFLIDSGSTCHVIGDLIPGLRDFREADILIEVGGKAKLRCEKTCTADVLLPSGAKLTLREARLVPGFGRNVISEGLLAISGLHCQRRGRVFEAFKPDGSCFLRLPMEAGSTLVVLRGICSRGKPVATSGVEKSRKGAFLAERNLKTISADGDHPISEMSGQENLKSFAAVFSDCSGDFFGGATAGGSFGQAECVLALNAVNLDEDFKFQVDGVVPSGISCARSYVGEPSPDGGGRLQHVPQVEDEGEDSQMTLESFCKQDMVAEVDSGHDKVLVTSTSGELLLAHLRLGHRNFKVRCTYSPRSGG